jgi:D-alanyl-D-alanine carboxypeptidase (penicillin-binding protein 5/6)
VKPVRFSLLFGITALLLLIPMAPVLAHSHHSRAEKAARHKREVAAEKSDSDSLDLSGQYPQIDSRYAVLIDADSGKILFSKNPFTHREPASLTKMAAAIVLLEHGRLSDTITAPAGINKIPESSLHLSPGEKITLKDLLYAMMLRSANDTPVAGAYYLCGSIPPFVAMMNQTVASIGCKNTHFVTPNGLYDPRHYSCAYDLAMIARYATLNLPMFDKIVRTQHYIVHRTVHKDDSLVVNTASTFLKTFPGADGIKTGFISQAGHCFVGSATNNGWRLIAVALDSNQCREDVEKMLAYGFANFRPSLAMRKDTPVGSVFVRGGVSRAPVETAQDLFDAIAKKAPSPQTSQYRAQLTPLSPLPSAPIVSGEKLGTVTLLLAGKPVTTTDVVAAAAVASLPPPSHGGVWIRNLGTLGTILLGVVGGVVLLALAGFTGLSLYARAITKNSRRRRARLAQDLRAVD